MGDFGQEPVARRGKRERAEADAGPVRRSEPADGDGVGSVAYGDGLGEGGSGVEYPVALALAVVGDEVPGDRVGERDVQT